MRQARTPTTIVAMVGTATLLALLLLLGAGARTASAAVCDTSWATAVDGDANVGTNWTNGLPGVAGPNTCITVDGTYTVAVQSRDGNFNNGGANFGNLTFGGATGQQTIAVTGTRTNIPTLNQVANANLSVSSGTIGANGRIILSSNDPLGAASAGLCAGTGLTNNGILQTDTGTGGARTIQGTVINQAAMNVNADTTFPNVHSCGLNPLTNNGGTVTIAATKTLTTQEGYTQPSGTTVVTGGMNASGFFTLSGGSFTGNAPVVTNANPLTVSGGTGTFVLHGGNNLASGVGANIDLTVEGTATADSVVTHSVAGDTTTNAGAIHLTSTDSAHGASLFAYDSDADSFTNAGTIETLTGAGQGVGGFRTLGLGITNAATGTIRLKADTDGSCCSSSLKLTNAGGQITIDAGKTFSLGGAPFSQTGGTTAVNGAMTGAGASLFSVSGGSFTGNAPVLTGKNFAPTAGSGSFVMREGGTFTSNIGSGFTVLIEATAASNSAVTWSAAANPSTNAGTIRLTSTDATKTASLFAYEVADGSLTNTGTIETLGSVGGRTLGLGITNASTGTIHIGADTDGSCCSSSLHLTNAGGTITIDAAKTFSLGGAPFSQTGGTTTVNGAMTASGGSLFSVSGGAFTGNAPVLTGKLFAPTAGSGSFVMRGGGNFTSNVGSGFTVTIEGSTAGGNSQISWSAGANPATNAGTIRLTSTDPAMSAALHAYEVADGSLTNTGTIETLQGSGGGRTLGLGITNASTGTIHIGADTDGSCCSGSLHMINAGTLTIDAGKLFSLGGATFRQTGGTTAVNGSMTATGGSLFAISGGAFTGNPPVLTGKPLSPSGGSGTFVLHSNNNLLSSIGPNITLVVEATAATNGTLDESASANGSTNAGTIRLTSDAANNYAELSAADANPNSLINSGTIETQPGAGGVRRLTRAITNTSSGTININTDTQGFTLRIAQAGTINVAATKTLSFGEQLTQTAGAMAINGTLSTNQPVTIQGGTLRGTGNVTASTVNNTGGTVHPGNSPGNLAITGNYTQGVGGTLAAEIAGTTPGSGYSRLAVSGNATLAGELDVTQTIAPATGTQFQVLTTGGTRTATFSTVDVHGRPAYNTTYNANNVTLTSRVPNVPTVSGSTPGSGSNDNSPRITGNAEAGTGVNLYDNATCSGAPVATGTAAQFAAPGIAVSVADNSTTAFRATSSDVVGSSACSSTSVTYVENSIPAVPSLTGTTPASGSNDNSPKVVGTAVAGSTVNIYDNGGCTGSPVATGTAADLASPGIAVSVADNSTTTFRATATDVGGTSPCSSSSVTYTEVTNTPAPPATPGAVSIAEGPAQKTTSKKATFEFSASNAASFQCSLDGKPFAPCTSPVKLKRLKPGKHTFQVRAIGADGATGATTTYQWKVKKKKRHH
jgi:hypothetical protein